MTHPRLNPRCQQILKLMGDKKSRTTTTMANELGLNRGATFDTNVQTLVNLELLNVVDTVKAENGRVNARLFKIALPAEESVNPFDWKNYRPYQTEQETIRLSGVTIHRRDTQCAA